MKKQLIRIISLVFAILFICLTPVSSYFQIENEVYAATFAAAMESEMMKQVSIPLLVSAGLVFSTKEAAEDTYQRLNDYLVDLGVHFEINLDPKDPQGPKEQLGEVILAMLKGKIIWDASNQLFKNVVEIKDGFFELIKIWVNDNYNVGNNIISTTSLNYQIYTLTDCRPGYYKIASFPKNYRIKYSYKFYDGASISSSTQPLVSEVLTEDDFDLGFWIFNAYYNRVGVFKKVGSDVFSFTYSQVRSNNVLDKIEFKVLIFSGVEPEFLDKDNIAYGSENIIDNINYDWINPYTNNKIIVLPVRTLPDGKPELDSDGLHLPELDSEYWVNREADFVTQTDPSGLPQNEIDEDEQNILVYLRNIFNQMVGIRNDTATMKENSTKIAEAVGNGSGSGGGTDVPTGFEWGDFKKFFDIFYIFVYFIVILILILLKLLSLVYFNLASVPANADLFSQYPTILAGVNYIKNLQVGGLSITVHQAFEYVFTVFFFIFIIKQIRNLYEGFVADAVFEPLDLDKTDYLSRANEIFKANNTLKIGTEEKNSRNWNRNNFHKGFTGFTESRRNAFDDAVKNSGNYENIKVKDYSKRS